MSESSLRVEGARQWLDRASEDLRAAEHSLGGGFFRTALFLSQQTAEKAIKGLLTFYDVPFSKTHDIGALRELAEPLDETLRGVLLPAEGLSMYAVAMRYPGTPYEPNGEETKGALMLAASVRKLSSTEFPREVKRSTQ